MNILTKKQTKPDNDLETVFNRFPREEQLELLRLTIDKKENNTTLIKKILWISRKDVYLRTLSYTGAAIMLAHTYMFYSSHDPIGSMFLSLFATGILLLDISALFYIIAVGYFNLTKRQDLGITN